MAEAAPRPITLTYTAPEDYTGSTAPQAYTVVGAAPEGGEAATWATLAGKPAEFPPEAHTHAIADVTGLQAIIDDLELRLAAVEDTPT
ncbi:MAG: hypothetical protein ACTH32_06760 [Microbacterium gubbeenense]|uniref:hypothetical protein n=1 Tax=Microbacterium gubbeenense TaxID=159896 RepID=UPI003F9C8AAE